MTVGIYFGTSTGQIFWSRDEGGSWEALDAFLATSFSADADVQIIPAVSGG